MRSPAGASARLVVAGLDRSVQLIANVALFAEYEAVMTRAEHLRAARTTRRRVLAVLDDLAAVIEPAGAEFSLRPQLADPDDEMVLEAAINGAAEAIVTFELRTFSPVASRFGLNIMTPRQVCDKLQL